MVRQRDKLQGILNGAFGHYLESEKNPFAITMNFYEDGKPLDLSFSTPPSCGRPFSNRIVILLHGLTNLETIWHFNREKRDTPSPSTDYGSLLERDFGYTPLYLRYNTGLSIKANAEQLNQKISQLLIEYPTTIDDIILLGFSMGGLLARSALSLAEAQQQAWSHKVTQCFYLGTPHEGAPLEKFAHISQTFIQNNPKEYISTWSYWLNHRSDGIKDLKDGLANSDASPVTAPFSHAVRHHFVSGGAAKNSRIVSALLGDGLVLSASAHPHDRPPCSDAHHFEGLHHLALAHSPEVYAQIKKWVRQNEYNYAVVHYKLHSTEQSNAEPARQEDVLSLDSIKGSINLVAKSYLNVVNTVETMHNSITDEPHAVLNTAPVIRDVASLVKKIHLGISQPIFSSLKQAGKYCEEKSTNKRMATTSLLHTPALRTCKHLAFESIAKDLKSP